MSKFSFWLTYSTCKNAKRKPQQKKSMCVNYTTLWCRRPLKFTDSPHVLRQFTMFETVTTGGERVSTSRKILVSSFSRSAQHSFDRLTSFETSVNIYQSTRRDIPEDFKTEFLFIWKCRYLKQRPWNYFGGKPSFERPLPTNRARHKLRQSGTYFNHSL